MIDLHIWNANDNALCKCSVEKLWVETAIDWIMRLFETKIIQENATQRSHFSWEEAWIFSIYPSLNIIMNLRVVWGEAFKDWTKPPRNCSRNIFFFCLRKMPECFVFNNFFIRCSIIAKETHMHAISSSLDFSLSLSLAHLVQRMRISGKFHLYLLIIHKHIYTHRAFFFISFYIIIIIFSY